MKTVEIKVGGMVCNHCVASVEKALGMLSGVLGATASLDNGSVSVTCGDDMPREALVKAIYDAGFDAE